MIKHRHRQYFLSIVAAAIAVSATPISAIEPERTTRTERVYFTCDDTVVHDVNEQLNRLPTWSTTVPVDSATPVGGCGSQDTPTNGNNDLARDDVAWQGTFTGNLDSITVDGYIVSVSGVATPTEPRTINVRLAVEGERYWIASNTAMGRQVAVTPQPDGTATSRIRFTITDIAKVVEPGAGSQTRSIKLFLGETNTRAGGVWLWGTPKNPGGLTFNPETQEVATVSVNAPCSFPGC
jgi:hypothetical protein